VRSRRFGPAAPRQRVSQCREQVDVLGEIRHRGSRLFTRVTPNADDVVALGKEAHLFEQTVVAELFAVVRRDDDQGVAPLAALFNRGDRSAELVVYFTNHSEVLRFQISHLTFVTRRCHLGPRQGGFVQRMTSIGVDGSDRQLDVGWIVK
jgi:hypothetical protein